MAAKKTGGEGANPAPGFEQALQRLEQIVKDMEAGALPLETMIQRFEEGQSLITVCNKKLNEVERRIEMLVRKNGETTAVSFDAAVVKSDEASAPGADEGSVPF